MELLTTIVLELLEQLGPECFSLGGGLGLFLKQQHLVDRPDVRTLYPIDELPPARTTNDADVFLRANVVADADQMRAVRGVLDGLGFAPISSAKFMQFVRTSPAGEVKLDLLVGPVNLVRASIRLNDRRAAPRTGVGLHARRVDEALGIETAPLELPLNGHLLSAEPRSSRVSIRSTFPYVMMKLMALRDRLHDPDKNMARHHAVDLYRIVAMTTEAELVLAASLAHAHAEHPSLQEAIRVVDALFTPAQGLGRLRLQEFSEQTRAIDVERFVRDLRSIVAPSA